MLPGEAKPRRSSFSPYHTLPFPVSTILSCLPIFFFFQLLLYCVIEARARLVCRLTPLSAFKKIK